MTTLCSIAVGVDLGERARDQQERMNNISVSSSTVTDRLLCRSSPLLLCGLFSSLAI